MKFGCFFAVLVSGRHYNTPYGVAKNLMQILLQIVPIHARLLGADARRKTHQQARAREMTICGMSAFAVAIGGKADMGWCTAYVCF
jgi:hypothetical protein